MLQFKPTRAAHQCLQSLLERCSTMEEHKRIHALIITNGLLGDTLTVSKLVAFCAVSDAGDISYARQMFDGLPKPNRFMWNSLIRGYSNSGNPREALLAHRRMLGAGLLPNEFTLPFVLKCCALESALRETSLVHALSVKIGFAVQVFVQNALLHAYGACRSVQYARKVFDTIPDRNVVSFNAIINLYAQLGDCREALNLFKAMHDLQLEPDAYTLASLLSASLQKEHLALGMFVHHYMEISGVRIDLILGNALVGMYAKFGKLDAARACFKMMPQRDVVTWTSMIAAYAKQGLHEEARSWFKRMPERNVVSWNSIISCYVHSGLCHEALDLYMEMQASEVETDQATLASILSACGEVGELVMGKRIHDYIVQRKIYPEVALLNSLVDMYAKCGNIGTAFGIFNRVSEKNIISWNVMIGGYAMHGLGLNAIKLFSDMVAEGISPDSITFTALLSACSHSGLLEDGLYYFDFMSEVYSLHPQIQHYACIVDLLGRKGHLKKAIELVGSMPMKPDVVIWGALLGACRIHGDVHLGEVIVKQLLELQSHNGGLYVLASNLYSEADRWGDVKKVWKFMKDKGIQKEKATSLIEINGSSYEFMVDDKRSKISSDIYILLEQLADHMRSMEYPSI